MHCYSCYKFVLLFLFEKIMLTKGKRFVGAFLLVIVETLINLTPYHFVDEMRADILIYVMSTVVLHLMRADT